MIDALFGSKTRVKLLHLFLNNPGKSFYVREITRLIDEQINSVRRELANLLSLGIIDSDTADNKLYYSVNQRYQYYVPLRTMFADDHVAAVSEASSQKWHEDVKALAGLRLATLSGVLVRGSTSKLDLLLVGTLSPVKVKRTVAAIERVEGRELNYSTMTYDEFYYRLSVRDRFLADVLSDKYVTLVDEDKLLASQK